jgi:hypothetical protein
MARKPPTRDKDKEQFWRKAVARQQLSGLSQQAFCAHERLNANNFSWWKKEVFRRDLEKGAAAEAADLFVPVVQVSATNGDSRPIAEIDIARGSIRIFTGITRHDLHELLAVLREVSR